MNVDQIVKILNLTPHPEGGFYRETYRSETSIDGLDQFDGPRNCSTGIYFLITKNTRSHLHKIKSDEMWHFYGGDPLKIVMLSESGEYSEQLVGSNLEKEESFQFVVPAGVWFGAEVAEGGEYSLAGCTVSPGFDFKDFEMADKAQMVSKFPNHRSFLELFCI